MSSPRIEICGGVASGKTTLATLLKDEGFVPVFEDFQTNPFWKQFYADPKRFAFEAEVTFLLQHYSQIKLASETKGVIVCDFSFLLDRAYVDVTLESGQRDVFLAVYDEVRRSLQPLSLLIHLRCGEDEELARIRRRARAAERGTQIDYLAAVNAAVEHHVAEIKSDMQTLEIDSERNNFAIDQETRKRVAKSILDSLGPKQAAFRKDAD